MKEISFSPKGSVAAACVPVFAFLVFLAEPASAQLRSDDSSNRQVRVEFENTFPQPMNLRWVDFNGDEHSFKWLDPDQSCVQQTTEHHVWVFRNREGNMVGCYAATGAHEQHCRIGLPAPWVGPRPDAEWISERGGRFVNVEPGRWTYVSTRGVAVYEFQEEDRTWEYVSLFDPTRGERVRLYPHKLLVRGRGEPEWSIDTGGAWDEDEGPVMPPAEGLPPGERESRPHFAGDRAPMPPGAPGPRDARPRSAAGAPLPPMPNREPAGPRADYAPPPPPASDAKPASSPRSRWDSNEGRYYQKMGDKRWAEHSDPGAAAHWFEEQEDTERYVSLYDRARDLWIRIYDDRVLAYPAGAAQWEVQESGGWTK